MQPVAGIGGAVNNSNHSNALFIQAEREKQWEKEYRRFEAATELRRARVRGVLRAIRNMFRHGRHGENTVPPIASRIGQSFFIPIEAVAGVIDEKNGQRLRHLPSGRAIALLWNRVFNRDQDDAYAPLRVTETAAGWHLTGGTASLVQLEVLRAKGHRTLRVTRACRETAAPFRGIFVSSGSCSPAYETGTRVERGKR